MGRRRASGLVGMWLASSSPARMNKKGTKADATALSNARSTTFKHQAEGLGGVVLGGDVPRVGVGNRRQHRGIWGRFVTKQRKPRTRWEAAVLAAPTHEAGGQCKGSGGSASSKMGLCWPAVISMARPCHRRRNPASRAAMGGEVDNMVDQWYGKGTSAVG